MQNFQLNISRSQTIRTVNWWRLILVVVIGISAQLSFSAEETSADAENTTNEVVPVTVTATINPVLERQKDLAARLINQDSIWLTIPTGEWLALYHQDETGDPKGTVILIPDQGLLANQPKLIATLAAELPSKGWSTLSVAMPVEEVSETSQSRSILKTAIEKAIELQKGDIYIVLHGNQQSVLKSLPEIIIEGVVLINLPSEVKSNLPDGLRKISISILDIIGTRDLSMNKFAWLRRKNLAVSSEQPFRQIVYAGVGKNFSGLENNLTRTVAGWLNSSHKKLTGK